MNPENSKPKLPVRIKNDLKFRELIVKNKQQVASCFYRITFTSEQLNDFTSHGFDDHIKLFFPGMSGKLQLPEITSEGIVWGQGPRPLTRDYTPLAFDAQAGELIIDFYIHDGGVASSWAAEANVGDTLIIGGPRGSLVIPTDYCWQLYVCDESGLPAVRRRLQSLPKDVSVQVLVNGHHKGIDAYLSEFTDVNIEWLTSDTVAQRMKTMTIPAEDYFVWITGEGTEVKRLSDELVNSHQLDTDYVRAVAYWHNKKEKADAAAS